MYAVIFKAKIAKLNDEYSKTAAKMRELAFSKYGCLDFVAVCEGEQEVAISYWPDEQSILAWKKDPEHLLAQQLGQKNWYQSYSVEVVEIKRQYRSN
ncbi:antibiotic biosynthesis monooxygenase [Psychrosphaera sp. F3M07]|uniref:antibiotic biosynthesis monooxygenase family protein n=1 Tax=Psychrosphaera sp. F3M07 TaxID=2841560 RepID=UPI001C094934|nr:antibiotic biosynthesis monooxygenase [Psychrosphaera sp. F3M07]MBU2918310.1 antibiotic biosynthesis monooxygenase [Psychrosphaera sp. F3M07]